MEEMLDLWNALVDAYGEDQIRELADEADVDISMIGEKISEEWASDIFAELLAFIVNDLAPIDAKKAMAVIKSAGVSDETLEDLFG